MELSSYLHWCTEVTHCAHVLENTFIYQQFGAGRTFRELSVRHSPVNRLQEAVHIVEQS